MIKPLYKVINESTCLFKVNGKLINKYQFKLPDVFTNGNENIIKCFSNVVLKPVNVKFWKQRLLTLYAERAGKITKKVLKLNEILTGNYSTNKTTMQFNELQSGLNVQGAKVVTCVNMTDSSRRLLGMYRFRHVWGPNWRSKLRKQTSTAILPTTWILTQICI